MAREIPPSALDLFRRWHNRYPKIEMGRIGFGEGVTEADRFYLEPTRNGKSLGHVPTRYGYPVIKVNEAGLDALIQVRSESGINPPVEVENVYWRLIQEKILEGRRFTLHLFEELLPSYYNLPIRLKSDFPAQFKTWPALKRGMIINPRDQEPRAYLRWSAFIPRGTPEYEAIQAANELAKVVNKDGLKPTAHQIEALQEDLFEKKRLVPA